MKLRPIWYLLAAALLLSGCGLGIIPTLTPTPDYSTPTFVVDTPTVRPTPFNNTGNYVEPVLPDWFNQPLVDVTNGETYRFTDFYGKLLLLQLTSLNCAPCLSQAKEIAGLQKNFTPTDTLKIITLDITLTDNATDLKSYAQVNNFGWRFSTSDIEMLRKLETDLGAAFLDRQNGNLLVIDQLGGVHPLPAGLINAQDLQLALAPFLK